MSPKAREISVTRKRQAPRAALALLGLLPASPGLAAPPAPAPEPFPVPPALIREAEKPAPYPNFGSIPPVPTDNPTPAGWKTRVVATRLEGARLSRSIAQTPWTLSDTEAFAEAKRSAGAPPAPVTTPFSPDMEARLAALRAQASAPPRSH